MAAVDDHYATRDAASEAGLRILHIMRAPVGGLFRHVVDLARAQTQAGHLVGVVADSLTGGDEAVRILDDLSTHLALGVRRLPMHRLPHPGDLLVAWRVARLVKSLSPDIVHGHGAKGGLYARLPALLPGFPQPGRRLARVYTPHGGSLHFQPDTPFGRAFFTAELIMDRVTDLIPFESHYARRRFIETIGEPRAFSPVIHNGLSPLDFIPVTPDKSASDFVFVGEMRLAKGVQDLLQAFATLPDELRLSLVGSGDDEAAFHSLARGLGISKRVRFFKRMPAREALRLGKILVVPSRAESLPYIVLEAIAARTPIVATNVGGVPEIFGEQSFRLAAPGEPDSLAAAMREMLVMSLDARERLTDEMSAFVEARFTIDLMTDGVLRGYRAALAAVQRRVVA